MVDARLPSRWLHDPRFDALSDYAWRMFSYSLMLANEQQSDGFIARTQLRFLHPEGANPEAVGELLRSGLWRDEADGYRVQRWAETQSTAETLARQRERSAKNSREHRARRSGMSSQPVTGDVIDHAQGKDRQGKARTGKARTNDAREAREAREARGVGAEGAGPTLGWDTVAVPVSCSVCSERIDPGTPNRLCARQDDAHGRVRLRAA